MRHDEKKGWMENSGEHYECTWVLAYLNGAPVNFKKYSFLAAGNEHVIAHFFDICKSRNFLTFTIRVKEPLMEMSD